MSHHAPELPYCRNCHFTLATPRPVHCGHCGQETDLHPPSVREMFTEYLGHYIAFDGPLWRTLWALVCLPGHLTNAYFHGRRRRYLLPLRVYLSASFTFFIGWALLPALPEPAAAPGGPEIVRMAPGKSPAQMAAEAASAAGRPGRSLDISVAGCKLDEADTCSPVQRWLVKKAERATHVTREQWSAKLLALAPYGLLAMQPVFAALLLLMFAGSGRRYAEHFVFSLHSHSLWFLALLAAFATETAALLMLAVFVHGLLAMRRVYGLRWWGAFWRGTLLSASYFVLLLFGLVAMALFIAATAPIK